MCCLGTAGRGGGPRRAFHRGSVRPCAPDLQRLCHEHGGLFRLYSVPDRALENLQQRFADEVASSPAEQPTTPQTAQQPAAPAEQEPETSSEATDETPSEASQSPAVDVSEIPENQQPPDDYSIPEEYQGPIIEEDMSVSDTTGYLSFGAGVIKNSTSLSDEEAQQYLEAENPVQIDSDGPQVLIMHTHATESFEPYDTDTYDTRHTWRTTDNTQNIVAAGEVMTEAIRSYGIEVLHDETQHDYPSYNGSYERSASPSRTIWKSTPASKWCWTSTGTRCSGTPPWSSR